MRTPAASASGRARKLGRGGWLVASLLLLALTLLCGFLAPLAAHEVRPAYLEIVESRAGELSVLWKTPMLGDARLALVPELSGSTQSTPPVTTRVGSAALQTWTLRAADLRGQTLRIRGLEGTMTDTLVRVDFADGTAWTHRLTARAPETVIPLRPSPRSVAGLYLWLGVEHILIGIDHLLFVLALLIITRGGWKLVTTVTAFTIAHSITLAAATLGLVHVPSKPVEAAIALSIVFVAAEIVHRLRGREGLTAQMPWIVAFTFGLLHGLGFAGALAEVGLPEGRIPLALLFFNIGVEAGQLLFVGLVVAAIALVRHVGMAAPRWAGFVPPYAIGSLATLWLVQRITSF
jgi:hydrogenase/urease accessory protein HupE